MKPLFRLLRGGKAPKMTFASFGRERDIEKLESVTDPKLRALWIDQTNAAHDLNDGIGTVDGFIDASRTAISEASQACRDPAITLLLRIARYYPECLDVLEALAVSPNWADRFTVACRLYSELPEAMSDRLFNSMRSDKSKRVQEIAISRYSHRFDSEGYLKFDVYDPKLFDDRVRRGEVKI